MVDLKEVAARERKIAKLRRRLKELDISELEASESGTEVHSDPAVADLMEAFLNLEREEKGKEPAS